MKLLIMILFLPILLIGNFIGGFAAFMQVAITNGYFSVMQILEKAQEK